MSSNGNVYERPFIAKAIVTFTPEMTTQEMCKRQSVLEAQGIPVPRIYNSDSATLTQDFIPYSVNEAIAMGKFSDGLLDSVISVAAQLDKQGFVFIGSFIRDLRTDLALAYVTDFGSDLGAPSSEMSTSGYKGLMEFVESQPALQDKAGYVEQRYQTHLKMAKTMPQKQ